ncbi:hypothetical protein BJ546DRAFT_62322 [Cryomyces antarcticus]
MTCICDDLAQARNELAETMMRKAGYWRYVNRKTYNAMVANNEILDWETRGRLTAIVEDQNDDNGGSVDTEAVVVTEQPEQVANIALEAFTLSRTEEIVGRSSATLAGALAKVGPSRILRITSTQILNRKQPITLAVDGRGWRTYWVQQKSRNPKCSRNMA